MKILQGLIQGSQEWIDIRMEHFNASEAPMMKNESKHCSRNELLDHKKGWVTKVNEYTQRIFDGGHAAEEAARPIVEKIIDDELYPVVGVDEETGYLASFDGLTMMGDIVFEHKIWNKTLAENVLNDQLEPAYYWQLEQQLLVSKAEKAIFVVSDGTEEKMEYMWYESVPERRAALIAGWKQFAIDLETHELKAKTEKVIVEKVSLPNLHVEVKGTQVSSNFDNALVALKELCTNEINKELSTQSDFESKGQLGKDVKKAREALKNKVAQVQGQFVDFATFAETANEMDSVLQKLQADCEKKDKAYKAQQKENVILEGKQKLSEHISALNSELAPYTIPNYVADFVTAAKNKRTIESLQNAIDSELASAKILTSEKAQEYKANIDLFNEIAVDKTFLFPDLQQHLELEISTFETVISTRITKHDEETKAKAEAELLVEQQTEQAALEAKSNQAEEAKVEPEVISESTSSTSQSLGLKINSPKLDQVFSGGKSAFIPKELITTIATLDSSKSMFSPSNIELLLTDENGNRYEVEVIARRKSITQVKAA
ncbi:YqaJ viral recombinase family protein [uncultured Psychrosphaera sp.]|uniref:YqaJ viral recombinase family protein n=1 Tax=uncultured Psychrosphaera sp. TaxID=1403522 RepID=UPI00263272D2|nr:YqaJ viral recombinase family protein [uncultured Psychrosphaera sp.]